MYSHLLNKLENITELKYLCYNVKLKLNKHLRNTTK